MAVLGAMHSVESEGEREKNAHARTLVLALLVLFRATGAAEKMKYSEITGSFQLHAPVSPRARLA